MVKTMVSLKPIQWLKQRCASQKSQVWEKIQQSMFIGRLYEGYMYRAEAYFVNSHGDFLHMATEIHWFESTETVLNSPPV